MKKYVFIIILAFLLFTGFPGGKIAASSQSTELPLDLAFTKKSLPYDDKPALSSDGTFLVYGIRTPPVRSPGRDLPVTPRYLPNGTPVSAVGTKLYITEISSGKTKSLLPEKGNCWRPSWSPDNKSVAFYSDAGGFPQPWLYDVKKGKAKKVSEVKIKAKLWPGDEAYWHPSGKEIYVPVDLSPAVSPPKKTQTHEANSIDGPTVTVYRSGKEVEPKQKTDGSKNQHDAAEEFFLKENKAALAAIDIDSGKLRIVVPAETAPVPAVLRLSPSGKYVSYLSVFHQKSPDSPKPVHDLVVVPAAGGAAKFQALNLDISEEDYFGSNYRWHPVKDWLVFSKDKKAWFVDMDEGKAPTAKQLAPGVGEVTLSPLAFTRDGNSVLLGINPVNDNDYSDPRPTSFALINIKSNKAKIIPLEKTLIFRYVLAIDSRILWQPEKDTCTVLAENPASGEHVFSRYHLKNGKKKTLHKELARFNFIGGSADHRWLAAVFENARKPPDLYQFNADLSKKKRLSNVEPRLEKIGVGPVKTFEISVPYYNGRLTQAKSALFLPPNAKKGDKYPTIVFIYGGFRLSRYMNRFGGGSPAAIPLLLFTSRGYAVLLPDLRIGPEGEGGNPVQEMIDALLPQVYHAADMGYIDKERVAVIGQSYGGYGAAAIISGTNLFKSAVAISGFYDLPGMYSWMGKGGKGGKGGTTFARYWSEKGQGRMGTHPWKDLKRYIANSPYYQADKINTPLLLLHGANDNACPVEDAQKMFNALQRLDKTAQLAAYSGEGHAISSWSLVNAVDAYKRILDFLEKHLNNE